MMLGRVVPMIHVPEVRATANWYVSIGFELRNTAEDGTEMVWALLALGDSEVMLNCGGKPSDAFRREFDLYIHVDDVQAVYDRILGQVEIVEDIHDTYYGQREFILRDLNRFWITFGQPAA